jgi:hypothetical protein
MARINIRKYIDLGARVNRFKICQADKIWSRYSNDKVDIGEELAKVIRTLNKAFPLKKPLRALSVGSSAEPQFRILETAFRGGLYLFDLDNEAISIINERVKRQNTKHVFTVQDDYTKVFLYEKKTKAFVKTKLRGRKVQLITLHHSLYYSEGSTWKTIIENLYKYVLAPKGAIHIVLMSAEDKDRNSTTWLYNHFVKKYFSRINDQDLLEFRDELEKSRVFRNGQIYSRTNNVRFFVDDLEDFMAVVWMIMLYPDVHKYSLKQRREITEYVCRNLWLKKKPLLQAQNHLFIYRGIDFKGAF